MTKRKSVTYQMVSKWMSNSCNITSKDNSENVLYFRKNFISLHIYFDQLETTVVKQVPKYSSTAEIFGKFC
jgi:hypothetical protein